MKRISGTTRLEIEGLTAVTLGKFDGIHRGHQKLLDGLMEMKKDGLMTTVFTFDIPPVKLLSKEPAKCLTTKEEKRKFMEDAGIDCLVEFPFTEEVSHMPAEDFIRKVLVDRLHARFIIVGSDFHFGYQRGGDAVLLQSMAGVCGYQIQVIEKEKTSDGREISSSAIRQELTEGNIELANEMLGYPYTITGQVVHGNHLGRTFGMPTINQIPIAEKLLPPNGVYVSRIQIDGREYSGVSNIGYKPTIDGVNPRGVETYIFDFNQDLYGRILDVQLFHYVRPEMKFSSRDELIVQMHRDADTGLKFFESNSDKSGRYNNKKDIECKKQFTSP